MHSQSPMFSTTPCRILKQQRVPCSLSVTPGVFLLSHSIKQIPRFQRLLLHAFTGVISVVKSEDFQATVHHMKSKQIQLQGSHYLLILKSNDFSTTFKDPQILFSRTNSQLKFTALVVEQLYLMFIYVTMVQ